jgi:hypothetical protein
MFANNGFDDNESVFELCLGRVAGNTLQEIEELIVIEL